MNANGTAVVLSEMGALGDETRLRLLTLLDRNEFTVSELVSIVQLPQPTVSRHLKTLSAEGWIRVRQEGTSRHYRMATGLSESARGLWRVVRDAVSDAVWTEADGERAESVLAVRRERAQAFFSEAASGWDTLRDAMFGSRSESAALLGLLPSDWVLGDLGTGTGSLAYRLAPFVARVIAVDRSPEMLAAAAARLENEPNVETRAGELEALPIDADELDLAVMMLTLHFIVEPRLALEEAARTLKPGGRLIVVDMREHEREEYRETMGHVWLGFSEEDMRTWALDAGFRAYRHAELRPDPEATGPRLFVGTAQK